MTETSTQPAAAGAESSRQEQRGVTVIPANDSYSLVTLIPATALSSMRAPMVERNS